MYDKFKSIDFIFFTIFLILISSTAFDDWLNKNNFLLFIYLFFSLRIAYYLFNNKKIEYSKISLLIVCFCILSVLWSYSPITSIKNSVYLLFQIFIIFYFSTKYSLKQVFTLIFTSGVIITLSSYVVTFLFPSLVIDHNTNWEGIFTHKNNLGNTIVFYIIINFYFFKLVSSKSSRFYIFMVSLMQLLLIYNSGSTTGIIILIIILFIALLFSIFHKIKNALLKIAFTSFLGAILFIAMLTIIWNLAKIFNLYGKDITFTGRDLIWSTAIDLIKQEWLLGYGFKATMNDTSYFFQNFYHKIGIPFYSLHNGYLEIISNIGVVGFILVIFSIIVYIKNSFKLMIKNNSIIYYFPISFIVYLIVLNLTESAFLGSSNDLIWCFFVYVQIYMSKLLKYPNIS